MTLVPLEEFLNEHRELTEESAWAALENIFEDLATDPNGSEEVFDNCRYDRREVMQVLELLLTPWRVARKLGGES